MTQTACLGDVLNGNVETSTTCQFYTVQRGDTIYYRNTKKVDDIARDLNRHIREETNFGRYIKLTMPRSLTMVVEWW